MSHECGEVLRHGGKLSWMQMLGEVDRPTGKRRRIANDLPCYGFAGNKAEFPKEKPNWIELFDV